MKGLVIFLNKRIIETVSIMCAQTPQTVKNRKTIVQRGSRKKVDSTPTARSPKRKTVSRKKQKKKGTSKWLFFKRWPSWAIWVGALSLGIAYILFFYYFFVGPYSFRWKAIYGDPVYPEGFDVHGIDVSHYQENIDWERLRNASLNSSPVSFVFIKATEGTTLLDDNFNLNFYEAKQNDFIRGAYHFFLPDVDAQKQARFFLKQVHLEPGDLPPVLDVEKVGKLTETQLQKAVKTWLDIVEKEYSVKPIIYTGYKFKLHYLNTPAFDEYPEGFDVHGIDVSHYQENIDWERLRNASLNSSPVSFVFIKATEGTTLLDDNFNLNFYEAKQNDFIRGAYHFFLPDVDAQKQARFFLKQVHLEPGDLPPVLDVEKVGKLTETQLQKAVKTWLDIVEKEYSVKPIIYTGYKFKLHYLNTPAFDEYPYWIAHYYVEKLEYRGKWNFWQHTDCGKVTGIKGNVDCNIFNGSFEDLMKLTIPEQEDNYTDPEDSL